MEPQIQKRIVKERTRERVEDNKSDGIGHEVEIASRGRAKSGCAAASRDGSEPYANEAMRRTSFVG